MGAIGATPDGSFRTGTGLMKRAKEFYQSKVAGMPSNTAHTYRQRGNLRAIQDGKVTAWFFGRLNAVTCILRHTVR